MAANGINQVVLIPFEEYYWTLKRVFAGDPEFSWGSYVDLPYEYVLTAIEYASKLLLREAHLAERPIAQLTSVLFNVNRGKKTKAVSPADLYQYATTEDQNLPAGRFGRAMQQAIKEHMFPSWALFVYKDLERSASGICPSCYIAVANDVCVLAPQVDGHVLTGLVIAQESASRKVRQLVTNDGVVYTIRLPEVPTKFVAEEEWELELLAISQADPE